MQCIDFEKKENIRILFAQRFPPPYVGETIGAQLTYNLLQNYFQCECFNIIQYDAVDMAGRFNFNRTLQTFKMIYKLRSYVLNKKFDILYFVPSSSVLGHMRDILLVYCLNKHVSIIVAHIRSGNFQDVLRKRILSFYSKYFIRKVDKFIFLSKNLASLTDDFIPHEKKNVIRNMIDEDIYFTQKECINKIYKKKGDNQFNILFLSSMIKSKGYWDLAKALTILPCTLNWNAVFIGEWGNNNKREKFEDYLIKCNIADRTVILGKLTDRLKIKNFYREADVFVLPTYYPVEAQPRSIIEAMNAATPIIATRHASIPEYVINNYNGYLVSAERPDEIAIALEKLADSIRWSTFAMAARKTYLELFSTEAIKGELVKLFSQ